MAQPVDGLDGRGQRTFGCPAGAEAEEGVDDQVGSPGHVLQVGTQAQARLPGGIQRMRGVAAWPGFRSNQEHIDRPSPCGEVARGDEAVPAIVARAGEHGHVAAEGMERQRESGDRQTRALDQRMRWML